MSVHVKAIVLVGGPTENIQYRPVSLTTPKPLVEVAGKPLICHHIEAVMQFSKNCEIILMGFFRAEIFNPFIEKYKEIYKVPIDYIQEKRGIGTAGGLRLYYDRILEGNPDVLMIINGDICCNHPIKEMYEMLKINPLTLVMMGVSITDLSQKINTSHYGCMICDEDKKQNQVIHYAEKPETFISTYINCGLYMFNVGVLNLIKEIGDNVYNQRVKEHNKSTASQMLYSVPDDYLSLEHDLVVSLINKGLVYSYKYKGFWCPIKTPNSLIYCNDFLVQYYQENNNNNNNNKDNNTSVCIHNSSQINPNTFIGPNVYIGKNCKIGEGTRISNCVIHDGVTIGNNCCIKYSIIEPQVNIGNWCRIVGEKSDIYSYENSDKICIIGSDVEILSEIAVNSSVILPYKVIKESVNSQIIL